MTSGCIALHWKRSMIDVCTIATQQIQHWQPHLVRCHCHCVSACFRVFFRVHFIACFKYSDHLIPHDDKNPCIAGQPIFAYSLPKTLRSSSIESNQPLGITDSCSDGSANCLRNYVDRMLNRTVEILVPHDFPHIRFFFELGPCVLFGFFSSSFRCPLLPSVASHFWMRQVWSKNELTAHYGATLSWWLFNSHKATNTIKVWCDILGINHFFILCSLACGSCKNF